MAVSKRLRYEILRRDGNTCQYCGLKATETELTVDHVVPTALGGGDEPGNLLAACRDCNAGKSASSPDAPLVAAVNQRAAEFTLALEQVMQERAAAESDWKSRASWFDQEWRAYDGAVPRDDNWSTSIQRFTAGGLSKEFLASAMDKAMGRKRLPSHAVWKYFCGICHRELRGIQTRAAEILNGGTSTNVVEMTRKHPLRDEEDDPEFPFMDMFDVFLGNLLDALQAGPEIQRLAHRAMWESMPYAAAAWESGPPIHELTSEDEPTKTELADDAMKSYIAHAMYYIRQIQTGKQAGEDQ